MKSNAVSIPPDLTLPNHYFFSVGKPAFTHSSHPPFRAETFVNPSFISSRATRALVCSSGQEQ